MRNSTTALCFIVFLPWVCPMLGFIVILGLLGAITAPFRPDPAIREAAVQRRNAERQHEQDYWANEQKKLDARHQKVMAAIKADLARKKAEDDRTFLTRVKAKAHADAVALNGGDFAPLHYDANGVFIPVADLPLEEQQAEADGVEAARRAWQEAQRPQGRPQGLPTPTVPPPPKPWVPSANRLFDAAANPDFCKIINIQPAGNQNHRFQRPRICDTLPLGIGHLRSLRCLRVTRQ